ncbi:serine hydrolase domain-containing protein [Tenacibaculum crassostreae]|uniref:serine hydrolase domain-containing protein n=1 Tax=Tenacibaculum crassostreae TaxID=502683 RepID=UPI0038963E79
MKTTILFFLLWIISLFGYTQTFQDDLSNEPMGDFPSQWDLVGGITTVNQHDNYKYIGFRNGGIVKPIVNNQTNNYLSGDFTVEFDVFFDQISSLYGQRLELRLWDGAYGYQKGNIRYKPFVIYRDGLETDWNQPEMGGIKNHLKEFQSLEPEWRHVKIECAGGKLKILLDNQMVLFIPRFKMQPKMISIGGVAKDSKLEANVGFTNFIIKTSKDIGTVDQIKFNRNISEEAHQKMEELLPKGIQSFSFSPNGGWVIITKDNKHFARNIPQKCYEKIKEYTARSIKIKEVVFPPNGGDNSWLIITENDTYARNIPQECYEKIQSFKQQGKSIESVSFPYKNIYNNSNNAWVILTNDGQFYTRNIPDECYQIMRNIRQNDMPNKPSDRKITKVSFTSSGGWVIFAEDYFFARNIPDDAFKKLGEFRGNEYNNSILAFDPDKNGWSLVADKRTKVIPTNIIREFENNVKGTSIWNYLRGANVPGIAVAVVINGELAWSTGYGLSEHGNEKNAVHPRSMFQIASISKFIAAVGALKMIEKERVGLDDDLQEKFLESPIPVHGCFKNYTETNSVTIRNILNHKSGIDGNGVNLTSQLSNISCKVQNGGYTGYPIDINPEELPNIDQIISGGDNVNSEPVTITYNASSRGRTYSGPGFSTLQKVTEDITSIEYEKWMKDEILNPLSMDKSRFTTTPEDYYQENELTKGFYTNSLKSVRNRYPEAAAAGMYSNAVELSNILIMLNNNGVFNGNNLITNTNASLITQGLGAVVNDSSVISNTSGHYSHGGSNEGYRSFVIGFPNLNIDNVTSGGIVILTNGNIRQVRYDIVNAIINTYGW